MVDGCGNKKKAAETLSSISNNSLILLDYDAML
jgi:hypothetical protein